MATPSTYVVTLSTCQDDWPVAIFTRQSEAQDWITNLTAAELSNRQDKAKGLWGRDGGDNWIGLIVSKFEDGLLVSSELISDDDLPKQLRDSFDL